MANVEQRLQHPEPLDVDGDICACALFHCFSRSRCFLLSHDAAAHLNRCAAAPCVDCQAQLEPTAESVLDMLLPAVCTFWPWLLACS